MRMLRCIGLSTCSCVSVSTFLLWKVGFRAIDTAAHMLRADSAHSCIVLWIKVSCIMIRAMPTLDVLYTCGKSSTSELEALKL